jgi:hypothetical protein
MMFCGKLTKSQLFVQNVIKFVQRFDKMKILGFACVALSFFRVGAKVLETARSRQVDYLGIALGAVEFSLAAGKRREDLELVHGAYLEAGGALPRLLAKCALDLLDLLFVVVVVVVVVVVLRVETRQANGVDKLALVGDHSWHIQTG